jgi:hypothetical protein
MRRLALFLILSSPALGATGDSDTFLGWSKDGSWFARQTVSGPNELTELFFCATDKEIQPSWPKDLDDLERQDGRVSCVRYTDPNRAPYGWKTQVQVPKPSPTGPNGLKVEKEYSFDIERPGYVVDVGGGKKVTCYVSGLREDSKLGNVYWHPSGRWVGAYIDGTFVHCDVPLKPGAPGKPFVQKQPDTGKRKPKK